MADYTPNSFAVAERYVNNHGPLTTDREARAAFYRWFDEERAKAWDEGFLRGLARGTADDLSLLKGDRNPYRNPEPIHSGKENER